MSWKERFLRNYAYLLTFGIGILIAAGGLVTSTGSGLSVPDWPLSYGMFFPPMVGGIRFEHSHRVIAGFIGLMTLGFTISSFCLENRLWYRRLAWAALGAVFLQALLGGLTVIYLLPTPISVSHACLGQSFFVLMASLALCQCKSWKKAKKKSVGGFASFESLLLTLFIMMYVQLMAGAAVRHTGGKVIELHMLNGFFIFTASLSVLLKTFSGGELRRLFSHSRLLFALISAQVLLGITSLLIKFHLIPFGRQELWPAIALTGHQTLGALALVTTMLLYLRAKRYFWDNGSVDASSSIASRSDLTLYIDLTKPRLTMVSVFTVLVGYCVSLKGSPIDNLDVLLFLVLGSLLVGGSANALNQIFEARWDALMKRTQARPIAAGVLAPSKALVFAFALFLAGEFLLGACVGLVPAIYAFLTWASYLWIYTPLKRLTWLNTFAGAIPGALPILIGYSVFEPAMNIKAFALLLFMFIWQLPHFFAIAWLFREDYERAGFKMLSSKISSYPHYFAWVFFSTIIMAISALFFYYLNMVGMVYLVTMLIFGATMILWAGMIARDQRKKPGLFVLGTVLYLIVWMIAMIGDKA